MKTNTLTVCIEHGADASPIALLVQEAGRYDSRIHLEIGNKKVNAKSIMGMMSLGLTNGDELTVQAEGEDEEAAVEGISKFLTSAN